MTTTFPIISQYDFPPIPRLHLNANQVKSINQSIKCSWFQCPSYLSPYSSQVSFFPSFPFIFQIDYHIHLISLIKNKDKHHTYCRTREIYDIKHLLLNLVKKHWRGILNHVIHYIELILGKTDGATGWLIHGWVLYHVTSCFGRASHWSSDSSVMQQSSQWDGMGKRDWLNRVGKIRETDSCFYDVSIYSCSHVFGSVADVSDLVWLHELHILLILSPWWTDS